MRLAPDETLVAFRREFETWLDEHLPSLDVDRPATLAARRPTCPSGPATSSASCSRRATWCRGGRPSSAAATPRPQEQMAYFEVITERMAPRSLNPQGLSICAASIVEFGTAEQKRALRPAHAQGRAHLVRRHERAQRRQRPGLAHHQGRAPRRPLRGERAEGVDLGGARSRLLHVLRAHRPRGTQAPRHQRAHHRHAHAGHHLPAAARADRPPPRRLQRGLLHRRRSAGGEPARRAQRTAGPSARDRCATSAACSGS